MISMARYDFHRRAARAPRALVAKALAGMEVWKIFHYDACVLAESRMKRQMLQGNIDELQLVEARC